MDRRRRTHPTARTESGERGYEVTGREDLEEPVPVLDPLDDPLARDTLSQRDRRERAGEARQVQAGRAPGE